MSDRNKVLVALLISALLHALAILGLMVWASLRSSAHSTTPVSDMRQVTMTVAALPKEPEPKPLPVLKPAPTPSPTPMAIDSAGLTKADVTPEHPLFESDINSRAASQLPADGNAPLPGQEGKDRPFPHFETKRYTPGATEQPPELDVAPAPPQPAAPAKAAETPAPTPKPRKPKPAPTPVPTATPRDALAMEASPTPTPEESPAEEIPKPTPVQPVMKGARKQDLALLVTPAPRRPRHPAYQPETEQTRVQGSISNRGPRPGADVVSTPLGRYRKTIEEAIGARWYFYVNQKMDLITVGSVHIKFYIDERGHVEDIKILSNTANGSFGDFSVQSITEAELPALPPDLAPKLENGRLEVEYTFTIY